MPLTLLLLCKLDYRDRKETFSPFTVANCKVDVGQSSSFQISSVTSSGASVLDLAFSTHFTERVNLKFSLGFVWLEG